MSTLRELARAGGTTLLPGVHDAISARAAEEAGFAGIAIGGSGVAATQLALPDVGLQSFGEYRDAIARILAATRLPAMIDGEDGFGDVRAVTRTVRALEALGVGGIAFEDLGFPPSTGGRPPWVVDEAVIVAKLEAALAARDDDELMIVGRTDAAGVLGLDEALRRARRYEEVGVDAVLLTGLADLDAMERLRAAVSVPLIAIVVEGGPWAVPTPTQLQAMGYELALYPATLMLAGVSAYRGALERIRAGATDLPPDSAGYGEIQRLVRTEDWAGIEARSAAT
jgi:2-methylisocitrate lyase-like PEP mutase family enzyme